MGLLIAVAVVVVCWQVSWQLAMGAVVVIFVGGWLWDVAGGLGGGRSVGVGSPHQKLISPGVSITCRCTDGRH